MSKSSNTSRESGFPQAKRSNLTFPLSLAWQLVIYKPFRSRIWRFTTRRIQTSTFHQTSSLTKLSLVIEEDIVWNKTWYLRPFSNHLDSICIQLAAGLLFLLDSRDGNI